MTTRPPLFAACLLCAVAPFASAQTKAPVEIAPFIGYRFGGSVYDYYGNSQPARDSASAGVTLTLPIGRGDAIEFLYSHQGTAVRADSPTGTQTYPIDVDYWMLGGVHDFPGQNDRLRPFLTGYLGAAHASTSQGTVTGGTRFALGLGGGAKYDFGRTVALRLDARAIFFFVNGGAGIFCGGDGCAASFNGNGFLQGEVTGGVVIKLGR